jgi:ankyrin repeat protein
LSKLGQQKSKISILPAAELMYLISDNRARLWGAALFILLALPSCATLYGAYYTIVDPELSKRAQETSQAFRREDTTALLTLLAKQRPEAKFEPWLLSSIARGQTEWLKLLLDRGDDANYKFRGKSLLWRAANVGYPDIVEVLISHGARLHETDHGGNTVLMEAANRGHIATMQVLISAGADLNQKSHDGMTALSYAVQSRMDEAVYMLLKAGADPNIPSKRNSLSGWKQATPLSFAKEHRCQRIIELLEKAGARE